MAVTYNLPLTHFWQPIAPAAPLPRLVQVAPELAVDPRAIAGLQLEDVSFNGDGTAWELRIHLYGGGKPLVARFFGATRDAGHVSEAHVWYQRLIEARDGGQWQRCASGGGCG